MKRRAKAPSRLHVPMLTPEDVIQHLGRGVQHWKGGYSAHSLAALWFASGGFPPKVRALLDNSKAFREAQFLEGFFERQTRLDTRDGPSQTDLLVIAKSRNGLCVIGVEGKAEENFGERIGGWLDKPRRRAAREARLRFLCTILGCEMPGQALRYQLFHRAVACVIEAEQHDAKRALLLVHSFSAKQTSLPDFQDFIRFLGVDAQSLPDGITPPLVCMVGKKKIDLHFAWVTDSAEHAEFWDRLRGHADERRRYSDEVSAWIETRGPKPVARA